jgi:hypothetical protein
MANWRIRGCTRCKGDLFLDVDERGWFGHCLQCGHVRLEAKPRISDRPSLLVNPDLSLSNPKINQSRAKN